METIALHFAALTDHDPRPYLEQKIRAMLRCLVTTSAEGGEAIVEIDASDDIVQQHVNHILRSMPHGLAPLATPEAFPPLSAREAEVIEARRQCMLEQVEKLCPLVEGETLLDDGDLASYLLEDWDGMAQGSVVFQRQTTKAVLYYNFPLIHVHRTRLQYDMLSVESRPAFVAFTRDDREIDFGAPVKQLVLGIAGLLPPPANILGAFAVNLFFLGWDALHQQSAGDIWNHIYENLRTIVRQEIDANELRAARQKIEGFVRFLNTTYTPLKQDPRSTRPQLVDAISVYDHDFFQSILNVFMDPELEQAGLANFMLGASLHLGLHQERALIDPNYPDDPKASSFATTVRHLAAAYAAHARQVVPKIVAARLRLISDIKEGEHQECSAVGGGAGVICTWYRDFWFEDSYTGYKSSVNSHARSKNEPDTKGKTRQQREAYVKSERAKLNNILQTQVLDIAALWDGLVDNPIALVYGPPASAPSIDPEAWNATQPAGGEWVAGFKVRYAVSFVNDTSETPKGPWSEWIESAVYAKPTLCNIPYDPFFQATGRKIYREFEGDDVKLCGTLANNQESRFADIQD